MDNDGISTKVSVLGDKEYKKALQDIGRRLTVLNTEMAATTSAFGEQADSMEAMQAKAAGLKSVYEAQAEKVRLIAEQLNKAKGEYEENSKQVQDLQIALNRARAAMNKTGSEIQKNDRAMESLAASTAKAATEEKTADSEADKLKQTLGDSAAKCAAYDQQLREVERSLKRSSDQSAGLAEKQELLQRKYETQGQACDELASAYRKSVQESGEFSAESVALAKSCKTKRTRCIRPPTNWKATPRPWRKLPGYPPRWRSIPTRRRARWKNRPMPPMKPKTAQARWAAP